MKRIIIILVIAFLCTGLMQAQTKILGRKVFDRGSERAMDGRIDFFLFGT